MARFFAPALMSDAARRTGEIFSWSFYGIPPPILLAIWPPPASLTRAYILPLCARCDVAVWRLNAPQRVDDKCDIGIQHDRPVSLSPAPLLSSTANRRRMEVNTNYFRRFRIRRIIRTDLHVNGNIESHQVNCCKRRWAGIVDSL